MDFINQDNKSRQDALHPGKSFIIQAPAGSGKTGLLTFRFLTLLSVAYKCPEECLAITFTKKAAAEMRERIISALIDANNNKKPGSEYEAQLMDIAGKVLQRNKKLNWRLLDNPMRLKIMTVDAFCASITQQMPLLSNFGVANEVIEDARFLYEKAAVDLLQASEENERWYDDLYIILKHLDNQVDYVKQLFANLLSRREQWLPYVAGTKIDGLKEILEEGLISIAENVVNNVEIPLSDTIRTLPEIATFAGNMLDIDDDLRCLVELNNEWPKDLKGWRALANFCLTKDGKCRTSVTKKQGFISPSGVKDKSKKEYFKLQKERMLEILNEIKKNTKFLMNLQHIQVLPDTKYNLEQWEFLKALVTVLPVLSAKLNLIFKKYGKTDFVAVSLAANYTLGHIDSPTDLMLGIDGKLRHILVDEFQDTSVSQLKLLEKIVQTWDNDDGRTLFLVGDPMQSIYRFRQAEVNIFFQVQKYGIGNVKLNSLVLRKNFRSSKKVVDWVNIAFNKMFSAPFLGGVNIEYSSAVAHKNENSYDKISTDLVIGDADSEAAHVINILKEIKNESKSIAILVRSRNNLEKLIPLLVKNNINFQGQEIEPLADRPIVRDLLSLTQSIFHLGDKLAWLSLLRSPWIGLELIDIYEISKQAGNNLIWTVLLVYENLPLRDIAKERLRYPVWILQQAMQFKGRKKVKQLVYDVWQAFGGEHVVLSKNCIKDANDFFKILDDDESFQVTYDIRYLRNKVTKLYSKSNKYEKDAVQIMTIHKSKGLEFDNVILLGLGRKMAVDGTQLFLWKENIINNKSHLIFAPVKSSEEKNDNLYNYLRLLEKQEHKQEQIRLLYVAATRAKSRLYLIANINDNLEPATGSLLHLMWDSLKYDFKENLIEVEKESFEYEYLHKRVSLNWQSNYVADMEENILPVGELASIVKSNNLDLKTLEVNWFSIVGGILHQFLFFLATHEKPSDFINLINDNDCLKQLLIQNDVNSNDVKFASSVIQKAINNILNDEIGKWILKKHEHNKAEWKVTHYFNDKINNFVIDRSFVYQGVRWIIDYKLHFSNEFDVENILNLHKWQLFKYARIIKDLDSSYPIKVGVYFPLQNFWHEYDFCLESVEAV